ncbi:MAG: hypothetical protein JKX84_05170 [Flavobacteriales bacterium]|nr:hypothetical protein [Flavobacteriales bacterium]
MKRLIFIWILIPFLGVSQENPEYFRLQNDSIPIFIGETIVKHVGDTITGQIEIDFSGIKRIEIFENGRVTQKLTYHENSNQWSERNYKFGILDGIYKDWYENGVIWIEGFYSNGQKDSLWTYYLPSGNKDASGRFNPAEDCLIDNFRILTRFNSKGGILTTINEELENHSCPDGAWMFYSNDGVPIKTLVFEKGVIKEMEFGRNDVHINIGR